MDPYNPGFSRMGGDYRGGQWSGMSSPMLSNLQAIMMRRGMAQKTGAPRQDWPLPTQAPGGDFTPPTVPTWGGPRNTGPVGRYGENYGGQWSQYNPLGYPTVGKPDVIRPTGINTGGTRTSSSIGDPTNPMMGGMPKDAATAKKWYEQNKDPNFWRTA